MTEVKLQVGGILFDMDGVLVSSLGSVERSWRKWAEKRGVDPSLAIRTAHGRRAIETVRLLRPDLNDIEELRLIEQIEVEDKEDIEVLKGVCRILDVLPPSSWTIVTSATDRLARVRLRQAGVPIPERIVTGDTVTHGKPSPEPYLRGAALLGKKPEECLVIEDSASGAKAGHAAGCKVLATLFSHTVEDLKDADWIVESLDPVQVRVQEQIIELEFDPLFQKQN
ncbi:MAG: HAD-IA family hydrolase [Bacillota bacterium]|jgi:sugar-phosphatase|nr:HAD-IA family hydrolase [Pseudacidobacterium ailaaui]MDI3255709.1 HAD-IA family hydrolase [Bacillota bacterium]